MRETALPAAGEESPACASRWRIRADEVTLAYYDGDTTSLAVDRVSVEIPERGFIGIMGPSGSGKSSLLYLLSGLKRPTHGSVHIGDDSYACMSERELAEVRRTRFGLVFQQPFLLNYLTARENVLAAAPRRDPQAGRRTDNLLETLGIGRLAERFPYHLSGGERQRVCVARAMINEPQVIFADEPTAALDHANGHAVIDLLASYRGRGAVIVVTHDPEMAAGADWVYRMRDGRMDGK